MEVAEVPSVERVIVSLVRGHTGYERPPLKPIHSHRIGYFTLALILLDIQIDILLDSDLDV